MLDDIRGLMQHQAKRLISPPEQNKFLVAKVADTTESLKSIDEAHIEDIQKRLEEQKEREGQIEPYQPPQNPREKTHMENLIDKIDEAARDYKVYKAITSSVHKEDPLQLLMKKKKNK